MNSNAQPAETTHPGAQKGTGRTRQRVTQPRSAEVTRRKILDAGTRAFADKGLDGTNLVRDVLEPAGVSVGSFYHQFADKTELLIVLLDEALVLARASID